MTLGDFDFDNIFRQFPGGADPSTIPADIAYPVVSFILWIIFLILLPILLTNLLVGLAVDDIKAISEAAVFKRLTLEVKLALSVEERLPARLRRHFNRSKTTTVKPNRKTNIIRKIVEKIQFVTLGIGKSQQGQLIKDIAALGEQTQQNTQGMEVKMLKATVDDLAERNVAIERIIREMSKKVTAIYDQMQNN